MTSSGWRWSLQIWPGTRMMLNSVAGHSMRMRMSSAATWRSCFTSWWVNSSLCRQSRADSAGEFSFFDLLHPCIDTGSAVWGAQVSFASFTVSKPYPSLRALQCSWAAFTLHSTLQSCSEKCYWAVHGSFGIYLSQEDINPHLQITQPPTENLEVSGEVVALLSPFKTSST